MRDVEYRMDTAVCGKLQAICQRADSLSHQEWTEELVGEFLAWVIGDGGPCVWLQLEKDLFANVESSFCPVSICLFLEMSLSTCQLGTQPFSVSSPVQITGCRVAGERGAQVR